LSQYFIFQSHNAPNSISAEAPLQTSLGKLTALPLTGTVTTAKFGELRAREREFCLTVFSK